MVEEGDEAHEKETLYRDLQPLFLTSAFLSSPQLCCRLISKPFVPFSLPPLLCYRFARARQDEGSTSHCIDTMQEEGEEEEERKESHHHHHHHQMAPTAQIDR